MIESLFYTLLILFCIWILLFFISKRHSLRKQPSKAFNSSNYPNKNTESSKVSCYNIIRAIRKRITEFHYTKGMVVLIIEECRVQIYFFDGIAHTSWGYNNHIFSTDLVGQTFLESPAQEFALDFNEMILLPNIIKREFVRDEISISSLWKLDIYAWDYEIMKKQHENDIAIRISFDDLQITI